MDNQNALIASPSSHAGVLDKVLNTDIGPYSIVSFDVFDTAVLRNTLEPKDVFKVMAEALYASMGREVADSFAEKRFHAELDLVTKVWAEDRANEVTLAQIYDALIYHYPEYTGLQDQLITLELATELSLTVRNPLVYQVYEKAIAANKKVIFASDIYLPRAHLEAILAKAGYDNYHRLYVSCELGKNKASGALFKHIISDLSVSADAIIHFGDSQWSDVEMANQNGLSGNHVPYAANLLDKTRYCSDEALNTVGNSILNGVQKNHLLSKKTDSAYNVGYEVLGPVVYGFLNWTIAHAQKQSIPALYFIAREGWFLKKAFDLIAEKRKLGIDSHYLLASRRSLLFPFVTEDIENTLVQFLMSKEPKKISDYLASIEVSATQAQLEAAGFTHADEVIYPVQKMDDYKRMIKLFETISDQVFSQAAEEKRLYKQYMTSIDMCSGNPIGVVDSGWYGSGQKILAKMLKEDGVDTTLHGFYFATHKNGLEKFSEASKGYGYFYQFDDMNDDIELFNEFARIVEVFLSAPSESFKRFKEVDGKLTPVYVAETDGELHAEIAAFQEGAYQFIADYLETDLDGAFVPDKTSMRHLLMTFIESPTKNEAAIIGSFPYEANTLQSEEQKFVKADKTMMDVLLRPKQTKFEFDNCNWRAAQFAATDSEFVKTFYKWTGRYYFDENPAFQLVKKVKRKLFN